MHEGLVQRIRSKMNSLIDQYDARLRVIRGYAELPELARRGLEQRILESMAECLATNNDQPLIDYIYDRAGQDLAAGYKLEWLQQAVAVPGAIVTPLANTVDESNFIWQALNRAQQMTWHIVGEELRQAEHSLPKSDLTDGKHVEESLQRNETQLSEALKIARLGYWEYDVEQDRFLFNDQFYSIFRTTGEQQGGYQLSAAQYSQRFVHPDDSAIVGAEIGKALTYTGRHYSRQLEHRILYADGGVGHISVHVNVERDEQGRIVRFYGANQDITERKHIEAELERSAHLLQIIIDTIPDYLYLKNTRSEFLLANQALARTVGAATAASLRGKTDFDFFPAEMADKFYQDEQTVLTSGQPLIGIEEPTLDYAGHQSWISTTKVPFRNAAGEIEGIVGVGRDITDRKQTEAERERLLHEQEKRALQLQTASDIAHAASSILNLDELLTQAAELIRTRFGFYYTGVFLTDDALHWAMLRAGTGEAGQKMLINGHKLRVGGNSMIGQCVSSQQAQIALDVGEQAVRFDNPLLPMTRSEVALPLVSRGHVIGAMTIQSDQPAAFTADDITVLQSMADQISNAVENARLYGQAQAALQEVDAINRRLTGEAWDTYLHQQAGREVIWAADDESTAPPVLTLLDEQLTAGEISLEPDPDDATEATITAPILLRGQPIGALRLRTPLNEWSEDTEVMLADLTAHIAQAVENARLIEQTQRTVQRERTINEINARVRQSVDLDAILRTAVNELGQSLKAARVVARVGTLTGEATSVPAGDGRGKTND